MSKHSQPAALRVRRSHEPNRFAGGQLASAYDLVLSTKPESAPPAASASAAAAAAAAPEPARFCFPESSTLQAAA
jgi:hypothetical protein